MKHIATTLVVVIFSYACTRETTSLPPSGYLNDVKQLFTTKYPNQTIVNLVFHGHSVPAGFFKTPEVNTLNAYPYILLKKIKEDYPYAMINVINTSLGGATSKDGFERINVALSHDPDVLFLDYALNDRSIGIDSARRYYERMILEALNKNIKVVLITPSPDENENILDPQSLLAKHAIQIRELAHEHGILVVDVYEQFQKIAASDGEFGRYMSQRNHPNEKGHEIIASCIYNYFKP